MRDSGGDNQTPVDGVTRSHHTLEVDGVRLAFGDKRVLQGVWLKVQTGRVTGLLGRNGCGKSCLMRIMYGSLGADGSPVFGNVTVEKSVRIDGEWVERAFEHGVVFAPQHHFIPASRLVRNVMKDYGLDFERLAACFPSMKDHYSSPVAALSGGERRILEVFTVLASPDARFCLLDEPFSQVSPLHAGVLRTMIGEMAREGKGVLVSDHLYKDVCEVSDDLYIIARGTTYPISPDSPDELREYGYIK